MDFEERVKHGYVENNGVKIHYATIGSGPLLVMIHGFPDYWYTWRLQMEALSEAYQCVAIDTRGYNLSDKPKGAENYGKGYDPGHHSRFGSLRPAGCRRSGNKSHENVAGALSFTTSTPTGPCPRFL